MDELEKKKDYFLNPSTGMLTGMRKQFETTIMPILCMKESVPQLYGTGFLFKISGYNLCVTAKHVINRISEVGNISLLNIPIDITQIGFSDNNLDFAYIILSDNQTKEILDKCGKKFNTLKNFHCLQKQDDNKFMAFIGFLAEKEIIYTNNKIISLQPAIFNTHIIKKTVSFKKEPYHLILEYQKEGWIIGKEQSLQIGLQAVSGAPVIQYLVKKNIVETVEFKLIGIFQEWDKDFDYLVAKTSGSLLRFIGHDLKVNDEIENSFGSSWKNCL
jgi:hypothetical protein